MFRNIRRHKITTGIALILIAILFFNILVQTDVLEWLEGFINKTTQIAAGVSALVHFLSRDPKKKK